MKCPEGTKYDPRVGKCMPCPGSKIRSQGMGRGLGYGRRYGDVLINDTYSDKER